MVRVEGGGRGDKRVFCFICRGTYEGYEQIKELLNSRSDIRVIYTRCEPDDVRLFVSAFRAVGKGGGENFNDSAQRTTIL